MLKPVLWALSILVLGALLVGTVGQFTINDVLASDSARGAFDRTLNVSEPVDLQVKTGSGSIRVHSGAGRSVIIHAEIRAYGSGAEEKVRQIQQNPPIVQNGNSIRIDRMGREGVFESVSISYDITVPPNTRVEAQSGSGSVKVGDVKGPVAAHTGSGSVDIYNAGIDVRAETGSGSIRMTDVSGKLYAHTGSGSINAQGDPTANWTLQTGSGSVTVHVPPSAAFNVRAHTGSGSIKVEQAFTEQSEISKHKVEGKVHGGGPLLEAGTGSGSIRIGTGGGQAL